jgi:uncharacterized protein
LGVNVHGSNASAVVIQRVPAACVDWFMEWQQGITTAAERFAGYRGTDVYPPGDNLHDEWVVVLQFDDEPSLRRWLDSPVRALGVEKLRTQVGDFELKAVSGGFGAWFAGLGRRPDEVPASWKMALTVLFGLYPTVMLLTIFVGPHTERFGMAVGMLIGNALSVSILQWGLMPVLTAVLSRWLKTGMSRNRALSIGGLCLLLFLLSAFALIFRQVTG